MPISLAGIADELASAPSVMVLSIVAVTRVVLAIVRSDTPVTRAIAELLHRRRSR